MITAPPTRCTASCKGDNDRPTNPAATPKPANTVANPRMKISVAGTAFAVSCASADSPDDDAEVGGEQGDETRREERGDPGAEQRDVVAEHGGSQPPKVNANARTPGAFGVSRSVWAP